MRHSGTIRSRSRVQQHHRSQYQAKRGFSPELEDNLIAEDWIERHIKSRVTNNTMNPMISPRHQSLVVGGCLFTGSSPHRDSMPNSSITQTEQLLHTVDMRPRVRRSVQFRNIMSRSLQVPREQLGENKVGLARRLQGHINSNSPHQSQAEPQRIPAVI